jgi:hypothetical protein
MTEIETPDHLPDAYRILPESVDLRIPGFFREYTPGDRTLAVRARESEAWFNEFMDRLVAALGREYLPVCRMSDGEFRFALGQQPPDMRHPFWARWAIRARAELATLRNRGRFRAGVSGVYSSGAYSASEALEARARYGDLLRQIADRGVLALHLSYGEVPFQEHFFPALGRWLAAEEIELTDESYYPFYFVYGALTGPRRGELLKGRRVLVAHGAVGQRRRQIEAGLQREGVAEVVWQPISSERSLFDVIELPDSAHDVDLALVGAGVGKPNVLLQLEPLGVPCIDAGFVFEVWADPARRAERPFCTPDDLREDDRSTTALHPGQR